MTTRHMLVITDASGDIIAAQVEAASTDETQRTFILPAEAEHALHKVSDVPADIYNIADPAEFHTAMTRHFHSKRAKVKRTSAEELGVYFAMSRLGPDRKKVDQY